MIVESTRRWVESVVIGLDLCPFARRVFVGDLIRFTVSEATTAAGLLDDLSRELRLLTETPIEQIETTLLIHPQVLTDFLDYNDFLDPAEVLIEELGLRGVVQLASFHPDYRFAGARRNDVENYTNRSPYPMLHLLREESITRVADDPARLLAIPERNVETLRQMGRARIMALLGACSRGDHEGG